MTRFTRMVRPGDLVALVVVIALLTIVGIIGARRAQPPPYADTFSTHDSDRGGYLALRRLLEREGVRVVESNRHPRFAQADRLVVAGIDAYAKVDIDELRDFVSRGKTLVVIGDASAYARSTLQLPPEETYVSQAATYGAVPIVDSPFVAGVERIVGEGTTRIAHRAFPAVLPLVADAQGGIVSSAALGHGTVIAIADPTIFTNRLLARADNARLAVDLLGAGAPTIVAFDEFVHGYGRAESAWIVLPVPLRFAIAIVSIVLLLALLGSAIRFVPAAEPPIAIDRNSGAYLVSLAALLRRGKASTRALHDLVDATFAAIARSFGLPRTATPALLAARAHGRPGASARIRELATMRAQPAIDESTLLHAAQRCAQLRKELDTDGTQRRTPAR